jgi:hypothetical protein
LSGVDAVPTGAAPAFPIGRRHTVDVGQLVSLEVPFSWRSGDGVMRVRCAPNSEPEYWGCWWPAAEGFPVCTATVDHPELGYRSMFGWVQLVRSTDNESRGQRFEVDPFALFGDAPSPYCWYGQHPVLFDAPSRAERRPLDWVAHSFLATTPLEEVMTVGRRVVPIAGFSWGFTDDGSSTVVLHDLAVLGDVEWAAHVGLLRETYPMWRFADEVER